jgi:hypothetical protein
MGRRTTLFLLAASAMLLLASVAILAQALTPPVVKGGAINKVRVVRGELAPNPTSSTTFVDIPGPTGQSDHPGVKTTMTVPRGQRALILARFSAESYCFGGPTTDPDRDNKCSVRIMIVNNATGEELEACPCNQGTNFAFDSTSGGTENIYAQESHSMDRSRIVGPGTYTVKAQWAVTRSDVSFRVDDWSFTVERATSS